MPVALGIPATGMEVAVDTSLHSGGASDAVLEEKGVLRNLHGAENVENSLTIIGEEGVV